MAQATLDRGSAMIERLDLILSETGWSPETLAANLDHIISGITIRRYLGLGTDQRCRPFRVTIEAVTPRLTRLEKELNVG